MSEHNKNYASINVSKIQKSLGDNGPPLILSSDKIEEKLYYLPSNAPKLYEKNDIPIKLSPKDLNEIDSKFDSKTNIFDNTKPLKEKTNTIIKSEKSKEKFYTETIENVDSLFKDESIFYFSQFFESMFIHLLFFLFFGPLTYFICRPFNMHILCKNFGFFNKNTNFLTQTFQFFLIFSSIYFRYLSNYDTKNIYEIEFLILFSTVFFRVFIICTKYGTFSKEKYKLFKTQVLNTQSKRSQLFLTWLQQSDEIIETEIQELLEREDIETDFFLFDLTDKIEKFNISEDQKKKAEDALENMLRKPYQEHKSSNYYCGTALSLHLYKNVPKLNKALLIKIVTTISLIHSIIPWIFRIVEKKTIAGNNDVEMYLSIVLVNESILIASIFELNRVCVTLSHCSNLLKEQTGIMKVKQLYPSFNIFSYFSYKSWIIFNNVIRSYGKKYRKRIDFYLSFFMIVYLVALLLIILSLYDVNLLFRILS